MDTGQDMWQKVYQKYLIPAARRSVDVLCGRIHFALTKLSDLRTLLESFGEAVWFHEAQSYFSRSPAGVQAGKRLR